MKALKAILLALIIYLFLIWLFKLSFLAAFVLGITLILLFQGGFATLAMLYSFLDSKNLQNVSPPKVIFGNGNHTFSLIIPARDEEAVIGSTLRAMAKIKYPKDLYEVLVVVRSDDFLTIEAVKKALKKIKRENFRLIIFDGFPINKAHALNVGFSNSKNEFVGIFDAEDEPHPEILLTVETVLSYKDVAIVQSGVQLINLRSPWFAALNCLEYYYWYKSILPFFSSLGSTPLGGNTVFFRREVLRKINGWDQTALTEDADIGVRLSLAKYKTAMIYEEEIATLEETPINEQAFIRQRSRWDQGFLQILLKGDWLKLPTFWQQFLTFYLLVQPFIHHIAIVGIVLLPFLSFLANVPLSLAIFSFFPSYFLFLQLGFYFIGISNLSKKYNVEISKRIYFSILINFFPYQFLLAVSSARAIFRLILGNGVWEKTMHFNAHRNKDFALSELELKEYW